jgi:hypothetical protein
VGEFSAGMSAGVRQGCRSGEGDGGDVQLDDNAAEAPIRRAMLAPDGTPAH